MNNKKYVSHVIRVVVNFVAEFCLLMWLGPSYDLPTLALVAIGACAAVWHVTGWLDGKNGY